MITPRSRALRDSLDALARLLHSREESACGAARRPRECSIYGKVRAHRGAVYNTPRELPQLYAMIVLRRSSTCIFIGRGSVREYGDYSRYGKSSRIEDV